MIEQRVTLRYGAQQIPAIVQAVQGDTGRDVIFELADYEIPAGATANYYIDKPDDTAIYNSAEVISSTEIRAHLTEQALAVPGRNNGQVRILSDDEVITSFDFVLEVEAFRGILQLQSETEVNIFDEALQAAAEDAIQEILDQTPVVTGMQNSIAPTYSSSSTYAVGDYVMYNAQLYRCITAITTAEAWTAAHWTQVPLATDVSNLKSALKEISVVPQLENGTVANSGNTDAICVKKYEITNFRTFLFKNHRPLDSGAERYQYDVAVYSNGVLYDYYITGITDNEFQISRDEIIHYENKNITHFGITIWEYDSSNNKVPLRISGFNSGDVVLSFLYLDKETKAQIEQLESSVEDNTSEITVLNRDLSAFTGNYHATLESGYRNMADPQTIVASENWETALIPCTAWQKFHIKGDGGSANQLWMFFDSNYTVITTAGDSVDTNTYVEITAPANAAWLVINGRSRLATTHLLDCIINQYLVDAVNDLRTHALRKYTQNNYDVSTFTNSAGSSDWMWANSQKFPAGYIDHFVVYGTDNSIGNKAQIAIYDVTLGKLIWRSEQHEVSSSKKVEIPCKVYFEHEIYVFTRLKYLAFKPVGSYLYYANMWQLATHEEGAIFSITWEASQTNYRFAVECWYDDYVDFDDLHYLKAKNKLFAAGDSITAGYPYISSIGSPYYYNPDIRWAAQVGRKLGFDVTFGAENGAGWIKKPDGTTINAISIADSTDFSQYNTVVFAYGTNDYAGNIPLGNLNDMYPANETVCGSINYVINKIFTDNPTAVLIISSPINRSDRGTKAENYGYGAANDAGYTLLQLVKKMQELCESNGIPFIDGSTSPFNKYNLSGLLADNLHPNEAGYKVLGMFLAERINSYVSPYVRIALTVDNGEIT